MLDITKILIAYDARADRLRFAFADNAGERREYAVTRRLTGQFLNVLVQRLQEGVAPAASGGTLDDILEARHVEALAFAARRRRAVLERKEETQAPIPKTPSSEALEVLTRIGLASRNSGLALQFFVGDEMVAGGAFGFPAIHHVLHNLCRVVRTSGWDAGLQVPAWTRIHANTDSSSNAMRH